VCRPGDDTDSGDCGEFLVSVVTSQLVVVSVVTSQWSPVSVVTSQLVVVSVVTSQWSLVDSRLVLNGLVTVFFCSTWFSSGACSLWCLFLVASILRLCSLLESFGGPRLTCSGV
jgi:hypothetical protein